MPLTLLLTLPSGKCPLSEQSISDYTEHEHRLGAWPVDVEEQHPGGELIYLEPWRSNDASEQRGLQLPPTSLTFHLSSCLSFLRLLSRVHVGVSPPFCLFYMIFSLVH